MAAQLLSTWIRCGRPIRTCRGGWETSLEKQNDISVASQLNQDRLTFSFPQAKPSSSVSLMKVGTDVREGSEEIPDLQSGS